MKIEQLKLENFKCFKTEKTFDFARLTILTGANSSGKSTVMQAILSSVQSDLFPYEFSTNGKYVNLGDFKDITYKKNNKNVKLCFKLKDKNSVTEIPFLETIWIEDKKNFLPLLKQIYYDTQESFFVYDEVTKTTNHRLLDAFIDFRQKSNFIGAFRHPPARTYLEKNKGDFKIDIEGDGFIDQIVEWEKRQNGKIAKLLEVMKQMDLLKEVKIKRSSGSRFEILVKPTNNGFLTSLSDVGYGVSQVLPIIVADLQLPNDSTLFLAEPEIHLHPSVQAKFGQYIVNQINTTDKNYIIETHSEYFLNRIRLAIVKGELKKSDVKVYFLENTKKDTNVYDIDFTKTGAIQNAPPTFFETYSMDVMDIALNSFNE